MDAKLLVQWAKLDEAHKRFTQVADRLPPTKRRQSGVCGEWSPKQVVAHLAGWDASLKQLIVDIEHFDPPYDVHAFNRQSVALRSSLGWGEVMQELQLNFGELGQAIAMVEPRMRIYDRVHSWMAGRIDDYELHRNQLEAWLP